MEEIVVWQGGEDTQKETCDQCCGGGCGPCRSTCLRCGDGTDGGTIHAYLQFIREELLYDIGNVAYIEGDAAPLEDEHARHCIIDVTQEGNVDRVTRMMDVAFTACRELLYPYVKTGVREGLAYGDRLTETDVYKIELKLPSTFSRTTVEHLGNLIHEYIVARVLTDWMGLTNLTVQQSAVLWREKLEDAAEQITTALNTRTGRVRRTLTPW